MRNFVCWASHVVAVLLTLLPLALSQTVTTGEVAGVAADVSGAVVSGASIVLRSADTGESRTVRSNADGFYRIPFLRPGPYDISASSAGLRSDQSRVVVTLGQVLAQNLLMKVEEPRQSVTVSDTAPLIDTDNAHSTYALSARQIAMLPLAGGDLAGVAYSTPGVVIANKGGDGGRFSLQGIGSVSNLFTLNGADEMDPYGNVNNTGATGLMLGANEIQEVSIVQNAYEGHYGRQAGAQVNFLSKSGANSFHGNAQYSYNGSVLNANDYFNKVYRLKRPRTVSNQYAGSLGGPIVRDKLFFFLDTEGLRYALPGSASVISYPSKALEEYTLKTIQPSQQSLYNRAFALFDSAPGRSQAVGVTNGTGQFQDRSGKLGCGRLNGTPTGSGGTFGVDRSCADALAANLPSDTSEWLLSGRVDYNLSSRQTMFLRFKADRGSKLVSTTPLDPIFDVYANAPDDEAQLNHTFSITPRLANNFIVAMSYYSYFQTFADPAGALAKFPFRFNLQNGGATGAPFARLGPQSAFPTGARSVNLQFLDDLSYSLGKHTFKAGMNYRHTRETDLQYSGLEIGRFNFLSLAEFATGTLQSNTGSTYFRRFPLTPVVHFRVSNAGFYLQDEWAATPRLMLTASLRLDLVANPSCVEHCYALLVTPFPDLQKGASIPYNQSIQDHLTHPFYDVGPPVVQPRIGFAWSPAWSSGTVLRGGIGLFADFYPIGPADFNAGNPPNLFGPNIRSGLVSDAGSNSAPAIAAASAAAFQNSFASGATLAQLNASVAPASFGAPFYTSVPRTMRTPDFLEWSLEVQRQFGGKNVGIVRYAGNHGYNTFLFNHDVNAAVNLNNFPNGFGSLPAAVPDPRFASILQITNSGYSNYNGLTFSFRRTLASGFQGQVSYTWSHAQDVVSNGGLSSFADDSSVYQINPGNPRSLNYSNADYDVRHNLTLDFVWDLPARGGNRALRAILGGWSLANRTNAHTGMPFTVQNFELAGLAGINLGGGVLAAVADPSALKASCGHAALTVPCLNAAQFMTTGTQTSFGNVPRNSFRGPGYYNVDTSLYKTILVSERLRFTVGASAFNMFNHPNLLPPANDAGDPGSLGLIFGTANDPSSPYGAYGHAGLNGRVVVLHGRLAF